ncbi:hypothetical protein VDGL01_03457 [Verticillium dahliae]
MGSIGFGQATFGFGAAAGASVAYSAVSDPRGADLSTSYRSETAPARHEMTNEKAAAVNGRGTSSPPAQTYLGALAKAVRWESRRKATAPDLDPGVDHGAETTIVCSLSLDLKPTRLAFAWFATAFCSATRNQGSLDAILWPDFETKAQLVTLMLLHRDGVNLDRLDPALMSRRHPSISQRPLISQAGRVESKTRE